MPVVKAMALPAPESPVPTARVMAPPAEDSDAVADGLAAAVGAEKQAVQKALCIASGDKSKDFKIEDFQEAVQSLSEAMTVSGVHGQRLVG